MIPNVSPGDRIQANQINPVIDAVNAAYQPLGLDWGDPWYESFEGSDMPWYVDPNTMEVRRPVCYVDGVQREATPYDGPSCAGPFYVGYNDVSGTLSVFDESGKEDTEQAESGGQIKHWEFQHVYDLYPVSVDLSGTISAGPPVRAAHFCLCPLFGTGGGRDVLLDLSSLDWTQTSASAMVDGEVSTWALPPSAQNYHYIDPQEDDLVDLQISSSDDYRFLARPEGGGTLKYVQLSSVLSGLSSMISAISAGGGGGGGCSCEMSAVIGDETYQDAAFRTNTQIAQFKDCRGNTTDVYAPDSVRFQGNVGA